MYLDLRAITSLSGRKIRVITDKSAIAYSSMAFSETRHFSRDMFPANTMAYDIDMDKSFQPSSQLGSYVDKIQIFEKDMLEKRQQAISKIFSN